SVFLYIPFQALRPGPASLCSGASAGHPRRKELLGTDTLPLFFGHEGVQQVDYFFQGVQVVAIQRKGIICPDAGLALLVERGQDSGFCTGELLDARENVGRGNRRLFAKGDQSMTEKSSGRGNGLSEDRRAVHFVVAGN